MIDYESGDEADVGKPVYENDYDTHEGYVYLGKFYSLESRGNKADFIIYDLYALTPVGKDESKLWEVSLGARHSDKGEDYFSCTLDSAMVTGMKPIAECAKRYVHHLLNRKVSTKEEGVGNESE